MERIVLSELAKAFPYAVLLLLGFILFFHMHKNAIHEIRTFSENSISEIRNAYREAYQDK